MTRSLLQPIRTRRVARPVPLPPDASDANEPAMTPGTRKTLAAIGALWVSFATSALATTPASSPPAPIDAPACTTDPVKPSRLNFPDGSAMAASLESRVK